MIVLINAISIKEGGSRVVLRELLRRLSVRGDSNQWHVAANVCLRGSGELDLPGVTAHFFDDAERTPLHIKWWYNITLPKLATDTGADVLFSLTNYLPDARLPCPTLLLVQHAGHFSEIFDRRMRAGLSLPGRMVWRAKRRWVIRSLRQASRVTVQTQALAEAICEQTDINRKKIEVIPHGPGLTTPTETPRDFPGPRTWHIGYVSKFGVQKNFGVLIDAAAKLVALGANFRLHLTLDPEVEACRKILAQAEESGLGTHLVNYGELDAEGVRDLYVQLDLFVFPSLCESFGFPMLEAMAQGIPMLVSDVDSNREMVGSDQYAFDGDDVDALAGRIVTLMEDEAAYREVASAMLARAGNFSWERAAEETFALLAATAEGQMERET